LSAGMNSKASFAGMNSKISEYNLPIF